jgi:hypothetical protein
MNATSPIPATATGIACAKCSHWSNGHKVVVHHANVADVKACHQVPATRAAVRADIARHLPVTPDNWVALKNLSAQHEAEQERAAYEAKMARDEELEQTHLDRTSNPWPSLTETIKPGRYAVAIDGVIKFYKIDRPTEGRWAGRTFVSVQASDELYPVRNPNARQEILNAIAVAGPAASLRLYGQEIGRCGHCNRTLTDATSRANGIGPICANKGW